MKTYVEITPADSKMHKNLCQGKCTCFGGINNKLPRAVPSPAIQPCSIAGKGILGVLVLCESPGRDQEKLHSTGQKLSLQAELFFNGTGVCT
jgi:hypothetical protein